MIFGSQIKRNKIIQYLIGSIPDTIISLVATIWIDQGLFLFFIVFIGLQLFHFIAWLLGSVVWWLYFVLHGRKQAGDYLYNYLFENKYPKPENYEESPLDYFKRIADDENIDIKTRLKSAFEAGAVNSIPSSGKLQQHLMVSLAYEDALKKYKAVYDKNS